MLDDFLKISILVVRFTFLFSLIPIAVGLVKLRRLDREQRLLLVLCGIVLLTEIISKVLIYGFKTSNMVVGNVYFIIELFLLFMIFRGVFLKAKILSTIKLYVILLTGMTLLYNTFVIGWFSLNMIFRVIESFTIILFALGYYFFTLNDVKVEKLERDSMFWISTAVLIYFSGNLFLFVVNNYLVANQSSKLYYSLWAIIHSTTYLITYSLYAIAIWSNSDQQKINPYYEIRD